MSLVFGCKYTSSIVVIRDPTRKSTETVSFRVNSELKIALEDEARRLGVNLNTLVCKIFSRYTSWDRYAERMKLLPVSKDLLREMFQPLQKESIEASARRLGENSGR